MSVEAAEIPLFLCEIEQFGGAERSLLALSAWLARHGRPNYLLTYFDHCDIARYATHPLKVVALNPAPGVRAKIASLKAHFKVRPAGAPQPIFSGYQPALHGTLAGLRGFHDLMHDTPSLFGDEAQRSWKGWIRIWISNRVIGRGLRSGGTTIVTSEFLKSECRRDFGVEAKIARMGGLSAAPSPPSQRPAPEFDRDRLNLLSVCRIEANKRIDWLLRSLAQLEHTAIPPLGKPLSSIADWHLDLAGKGSMIPEIERLAESLGIASRVHLHGFVSDEDLDNLYARAHLFLMPAVQGYGIPAIEALARGIPVLLHRDSGVSDILLDTPWATVLHGGEESLTARLAEAIEGTLNGRHLSIDPPALPTEDEWARRVAELCHYV
jgi:glycosyltransferase involved in cell wall biosynthesis